MLDCGGELGDRATKRDSNRAVNRRSHRRTIRIVWMSVHRDRDSLGAEQKKPTRQRKAMNPASYGRSPVAISVRVG
jgi:hypothetical protein